MNGQQGKIGVLPLFCIFALGIGLMNHVMVIPPLLATARRDAWLSVLAITLPYLAWTAVLYGIMRFTRRQPLLTWLQRRYGKATSGAARTVFAVYLFVIVIMTLKETVMWTHTSYLPRSPILALSLSLMLLAGIAAWCGIQAIAITSGILLPFVIVFGDFVMSANLPAKNYALLTPLLEHGWPPVLWGMLYVGGGLAELIVLLLFQHELKSGVALWKMLLLSTFLVMLVLGPVTGAIAEFGPFEAAKLRYPAFEEWRLVKIGKYIRHVDFLSIYQWLSGAFVRIAASLLLLADLLSGDQSSAGGNRSKVFWIGGLAAVSVAIAELPVSDRQYLHFLRYVYLPASCWGAAGLALALFGMAWAAKNRGNQRNGS